MKYIVEKFDSPSGTVKQVAVVPVKHTVETKGWWIFAKQFARYKAGDIAAARREAKSLAGYEGRIIEDSKHWFRVVWAGNEGWRIWCPLEDRVYEI